ncbi:MAG: AroM family protein [Candidatus Aminicenantales bacterium]
MSKVSLGIRKLGFVTIGQSPRDDVFDEISVLLSPEIEILERGALDGISDEEITGLRPEKDDFPLITRLKMGSSVVVGRRKILPLIQKQVEKLEEEGAQAIAFLCTENFPEIKSDGLLLFPYRILFHSVLSLLESGKLAVFVPLEEQKKYAREKWEKTGFEVVVEDLNPYLDSPEIEKSLMRIQRENPALVVLDCIGYSIRVKEKVRQMMGRPVLLPRSILARTINELI